MKKNIGTVNALYPMPTILAGALVEGKPNYLAIGHVGIFTHQTVSLGINKAHYTNQGIKENKTFSVCIPSEDMIEVTDYCGLVSGSKEDKSKVFDVFYGKLKTAPMITKCPVNLECSLDKVIDNASNEMFIGDILSTYTEKKYLTDEAVNIKKARPFILSLNDRQYYGLNEPIAKAWAAGKNYKP